MNWHPDAELFPMLEGDAWEAFKEGIKATNGNSAEPIELRLVDGAPEGIDGRNRYQACKELGLEPTFRTIELADEDVWSYILRKNISGRRHLDAKTRRALVSKLRASGESTRTIAEKLGLAKSTVHTDLNSTVQNGTVDTVKGKDGRKRRAKRKPKDEGDASETPLMCSRCTRVGVKTKDCAKCAELARKSAEKKGKKAGPQKNGQVYDFHPFHGHFGGLIRECDILGKLYGAKESADHEKLQRQLGDFKTAFTAWHSSLTRKK